MIPSVSQGGHARVACRWSRRTALAAGSALIVFLSSIEHAAAQDNGDSSKVGDLTGNLPLAVYLLIPLALVLALLTAIALGPAGDPGSTTRRGGGVTRALTEREESAEQP
jgi:hypothetical protein